MDLIFIRHAIAEDRQPEQTEEQDARRRLTGEGIRTFTEVAHSLSFLLSGTAVNAVWTSPYRRARETAEILVAAGAFPVPEFHPFLTGKEPGEWSDLEQLSPDSVCIWVGHEPYLSDWCRQLTGKSVRLRKGSVLYIRLDGNNKESGRILWTLRPRALRAWNAVLPEQDPAVSFSFPPGSIQHWIAGAVRDELAGCLADWSRLCKGPDRANVLHDFRLHARALLTMLEAAHPLLKKRKRKTLRAAVRRLLKDTAERREWDVLLRDWNVFRSECNNGRLPNTSEMELSQQMLAGRKQRDKKMRDQINSKSWSRGFLLLASFHRFMRAGATKPETAYRSSIRSEWLARISGMGTVLPDRYHRLRICIKKIRVLDTVDSNRPMMSLLERLQDELGRYHDADVHLRLIETDLNDIPGADRFAEWLRNRRTACADRCAVLLADGSVHGKVEDGMSGDPDIEFIQHTEEDRMQVRFGIIGVGNMGSAHARTIASGQVEGAVLSAVADLLPERIQALQGDLPDSVQYYASAEALMDSGIVDAVIIAVPHYDHPGLAVAAMEKGLHVLVEKPAGVYTRQVREMNQTAFGHPEIKFGIMFNNRTNPLYIRMHDMIAAGELGDIKRTSWIITDWYRSQSYYDSGSWRATWKGEGGGVLLNQSPHNLDLWQWIVGMMPLRVRAFCHEGKWHDIEVEDDVTAYVEYPNGATGTFITSTADTPGTNRFEITGNLGKLVAEEGKLTFHKLAVPEREWNRTYKGGFGQPEVDRIEVDVSGDFPNHAGILQDFTTAVLEDRPLWAPGLEGIRSLEISNAMHLSSWLGRTVDVPIDENMYYELLEQKAAGSVSKISADTATLDMKDSF